MFLVLRPGMPCVNSPERHGPGTTVYNQFHRWRQAGVWDRLVGAIVKLDDGDVPMIDRSIVRVHQQEAN